MTTTKKPGKIVSYVNVKGVTQFAVAYDADQMPGCGKIFLNLLNDDYSPQKINGKDAKVMKSAEALTFLGFMD